MTEAQKKKKRKLQTQKATEARMAKGAEWRKEVARKAGLASPNHFKKGDPRTIELARKGGQVTKHGKDPVSE